MEDDSLKALDRLRRGEVILYPTDTVWGIGCDACREESVRRIYSLKRRSDSKSMLVLVDSVKMLSEYVNDIPREVIEIINNAARPTTVILPGGNGIAPSLLATDGSVGFRISRDPFSAGLCHALGHPIVSTSANISGQLTPQTFGEISDEIKDGVDYVCTTRREDSDPHQPSRIIKFEDNRIIVIRD